MEEFWRTKKIGYWELFESLNRTEIAVWTFFIMETNGMQPRPINHSFSQISEIIKIDRSHIAKAFKSLLLKKVIKKTEKGYVLKIGVINKEIESSVAEYATVLNTKEQFAVAEYATVLDENKNILKNNESTVAEYATDCGEIRHSSYLYNRSLEKADKRKEDNNIILPKKVSLQKNEEFTKIANATEIANYQPREMLKGRVKPSYSDPILEPVKYLDPYNQNDMVKRQNIFEFKKCVDLIICVWDASRRGNEKKAKQAFVESVSEDLYSIDLIERFEQAFYAYSKDEFQKKVKAMNLEKWASQWDNWTEVYIERTRNNEIKKIDPAGSYWILIREKLKG